MKNKKIDIKLILIAVLTLTIGFSACNSNNNFVNPKELIEAEQQLLDRYYNEMMSNDMVRLDSMTAAALDTMDHRFESGLMLFHTKIGDGDSIKIFNKVGYRFTAYNIAQDTLDVTYEAYAGSNDYSNAPVSYTTYLLNDAASANATGVPLGINEALLNMRYGGEAKVVLPSAIGGVNGYYTTIYELRVTYLEQ